MMRVHLYVMLQLTWRYERVLGGAVDLAVTEELLPDAVAVLAPALPEAHVVTLNKVND